MNPEWLPYIVAAAGAAYVAWGRKDQIKGLLGGLMPSAKPVNGTLARVNAWEELKALCEGECPQAVKLLDELFPHLRSGHSHEVTK